MFLGHLAVGFAANRAAPRTSLGLLVAAIAAVVIWYLARPERQDSFGIVACAALYRAASSLADTVRIDGQRPLERGRAELNPFTCGALRATYPDRVVPVVP